MAETDLAEWWKETGSKKLNDIVINLAGSGIGYVPFSNLTDDFVVLSDKNQEELIPLMVADGCTVKTEVFPNGRHRVLLYVK